MRVKGSSLLLLAAAGLVGTAHGMCRYYQEMGMDMPLPYNVSQPPGKVCGRVFALEQQVHCTWHPPPPGTVPELHGFPNHAVQPLPDVRGGR